MLSQKAQKEHLRSTDLQYKRFVYLGLLGLIHAYLVWYGDVLFMYAVCGLLMFIFRNKRNNKIWNIFLLRWKHSRWKKITLEILNKTFLEINKLIKIISIIYKNIRYVTFCYLWNDLIYKYSRSFHLIILHIHLYCTR